MSGLGDERLSVIKSVEIHELIRSVDASQAEAVPDGLPDYLVNDLVDPDDLPDTLYLSDGSVAEVGLGDPDSVVVDGPPSLADLQIEVTVDMTAGWSYLKMDDPSSGDLALIGVERSDGTQLPAKNFWQTDRTFVGQGRRPVLEDKIHLLDDNSTGTYTFTFSNGDVTGPDVTGFAGVEPNPTSATVDVIDVQFSERLSDATFDGADLQLSKNGVPVALGAEIVVNYVVGSTYRVSGLAAHTADDAVYELAVDSTGVTDLVGNAGVGTDRFTWVKGAAAPAVLQLIGVPGSLTTSNVPSIDIVFTEPIVLATLSLADLSLTRDGNELLDGQVTIAQVGTSTYRIGNLANLTGVDGDYRFEVQAAGVEDTDGNAGIGVTEATWTLDGTAAVVLALVPPATNPRNIVVQQIDVDFSEPIDLATLDVGDLTLVQDGGSENLIEGDDRVFFEHRFDNTYRIYGINWVQAFVADPQIADFTLTIDGSGILDLAGNVGTGTASATWTIDLDRPVAATNLALDTASGPVVGGVVDSIFATVSGDLEETDLTIAVRDMTTDIELARETFTGLQFSLPIVFPSVGQHDLRVRVIDVAGNTRDALIEDLFVDQAPPVVLDILNRPPEVTELNAPPVVTTDAPVFLDVVFNQLVNFDGDDIALTRNFGPDLIAANVSIDLVVGSTGTYRIGGLANLTDEDGLYEFSIDLTGVENLLGNTGVETTSISWIRDATAPTSSVASLSVRQDLHGVVVSVAGDDSAPAAGVPGSGVAFYDVEVSSYSMGQWSPFQLWQSLPADNPTGTFVAESDHFYLFRSVARDAAGNAESKPLAIEAWTYVPDLDAPVTQVDAVDSSTSALRIDFSGTDAGGNGMAYFDLLVEIDGAAAQLVGRFSAGSPDGGGVYSGSTVYQALADGSPHTYRFFTVGADRGSIVETEPVPPGDVEVTATFAPPATLAVTDFDVQRGAEQRSFVRFLDVTLNDTGGLGDLLASMSDGDAANDRVRLRRFELDGSGAGDLVD
ncbi:MAG: hypothetical protein ACC645_19770, partial [Pirellulales bacterium]